MRVSKTRYHHITPRPALMVSSVKQVIGYNPLVLFSQLLSLLKYIHNIYNCLINYTVRPGGLALAQRDQTCIEYAEYNTCNPQVF